eukprot:scaffold199204_cov35-Tisochrysis_lutea.AAC.1
MAVPPDASQSCTARVTFVSGRSMPDPVPRLTYGRRTPGAIGTVGGEIAAITSGRDGRTAIAEPSRPVRVVTQRPGRKTHRGDSQNQAKASGREEENPTQTPPLTYSAPPGARRTFTPIEIFVTRDWENPRHRDHDTAVTGAGIRPMFRTYYTWLYSPKTSKREPEPEPELEHTLSDIGSAPQRARQTPTERAHHSRRDRPGYPEHRPRKKRRPGRHTGGSI